MHEKGGVMIGVPDAVGEGSRQDSKSICKDKRLKIHGNFVLLNEEVFFSTFA